MRKALLCSIVFAVSSVACAEDNHYWRDEDGAYVRSAKAYAGTLPPVNAVRVAPPAIAEGYWPRIRDDRSGWDLAEDHRGREGYVAGEWVKIATVGPLPQDWSDEPPAPEKTLDDMKAEKKAEIDANTNRIRDRDGLAYDGKRFDMRDTAMLKWTGMMAAKDILPYPMTILTMDDQPYILANQTALMGFLVSVLGYETDPSSPLTTGRVLRNRVEAAATIADVEAIIDDRD